MTLTETCFERRNLVSLFHTFSVHIIKIVHLYPSLSGEAYPMAVRGQRRAPFGAPRSARPLLPADGVYSAGRAGERDLKEGMDEGA